MDGWIKLHRGITDHWIWKDPVKLKWWLDVLMFANHEDKKINIGMQLVDCKRGQCVLSLVSWGKRWGVSKHTVHNFFTLLKNDNMITTENLTKTTRITICNYETYQETSHAKETQKEQLGNASETDGERIGNALETQRDTNKNVKKDKKDKNVNNIINPPISPSSKGETEPSKKVSKKCYPDKNPPPAEENQKSCGKKGNELAFVAEEFLPLVKRWLRYKADKKQSYRSEDSIRAMYDKLIRYSGGSLTAATEIIEDAMAKNYNGFFELKNYGNNERKSNGDIGKTIIPNTVAKRESTI